jgi:hypothetical protein
MWPILTYTRSATSIWLVGGSASVTTHLHPTRSPTAVNQRTHGTLGARGRYGHLVSNQSDLGCSRAGAEHLISGDVVLVQGATK